MNKMIIALYVRVMECINALKSERGQGIVEYALILVLIAIVAIASMKMIGGNVSNAFSQAASATK